jgi:hypothetical protein
MDGGLGLSEARTISPAVLLFASNPTSASAIDNLIQFLELSLPESIGLL